MKDVWILLFREELKMNCMDCKPCKYSKMIIKNVDDHLTAYAFFCEKYGIYGDTFKELNQNVREEKEEQKC